MPPFLLRRGIFLSLFDVLRLDLGDVAEILNEHNEAVVELVEILVPVIIPVVLLTKYLYLSVKTNKEVEVQEDKDTHKLITPV